MDLGSGGMGSPEARCLATSRSRAEIERGCLDPKETGTNPRNRWGLLSLLSVSLVCACNAVAPASSVTRSAKGDARISVAARVAPIARVDTTDAWLDLIAQRPSAVLLRRGRVVVDLGHPAAAKHVELGQENIWSLAEEVDGRRAAIVQGRSGSLEIPLDGDLAPALHPDDDKGDPTLAMAITLKGLVPKQTVSVLWEERILANLLLSESWERRTFSLPTELLRTGENHLRLHFRRTGTFRGQSVSAAVQTVEVGTLQAIREGAPETVNYRHETGSSGGGRLSVPRGMSLAYYIVPPRRGHLHMDVFGSGAIEVLASTDAQHDAGEVPVRLLAEPLRETGQDLDVDLSGYAGIPTRIEIRVQGSDPGDGAMLRALDVIAHRSIPIDRRARELRNIYVLALEGVRPDDLLGLRRKGPQLEVIRKFAAESLVFDRAYAVGVAAVPSHAAVLSSVVPPGHLTLRGTFIAQARALLPEVLDRAGYYNIAISANADVSRERGFTQGVDHHRLFRGAGPTGSDADNVVTAIFRQLELRPSPRFVYAVFSDAQAPYDPPHRYMENTEVPDEAPVPHRTHMWVARVRAKRIEPDKAQLGYVHRLYLGEIEALDAAVGKFLVELENRGELEASIVVLVGIHGEEFLEHGGAGHGRTLFEESIRVPFAIRAPKLLAPGRVDEPVDLLDLAPTLADLVGVAPPNEWHGASLVPIIDDPQPPPRLLVSYFGDGSQAGIIGDYKLILGSGVGVGNQRFYDLKKDPHETSDRRDEAGIALRMLRTALRWERSEQPNWKRARWGTGANLSAVFAIDHGL